MVVTFLKLQFLYSNVSAEGLPWVQLGISTRVKWNLALVQALVLNYISTLVRNSHCTLGNPSAITHLSILSVIIRAVLI